MEEMKILLDRLTMVQLLEVRDYLRALAAKERAGGEAND